jgi:hypothetical protein
VNHRVQDKCPRKEVVKADIVVDLISSGVELLGERLEYSKSNIRVPARMDALGEWS